MRSIFYWPGLRNKGRCRHRYVVEHHTERMSVSEQTDRYGNHFMMFPIVHRCADCGDTYTTAAFGTTTP